MKVTILTEGGKGIGFGHVTRCLALYQAFKKKQIAPLFIIKGDSSIKSIVYRTKYDMFNWIKKKDTLIKKIINSDIVIVDSYLAQENDYKEILNHTQKLVCIDDNFRLHYPKGIIINPNIIDNSKKYQNEFDSQIFSGPAYALLRKEFWNIPQKKIRKKLQTILITFGGTDDINLVPKLLDSICHRFPNLLKNVIIGSGFSNIDKIKRIVDNNTRLFYSPEPNSLINIIVSSDIAISAAGQTLFELARCGIPIIAVAVANNQKTNISQFKKLGLTLSSNNCLNNKIMENIIDDMVILSDQKIRKRVSDRAMKLIDGKGSGRIVDYLVNGKVNKAV